MKKILFMAIFMVSCLFGAVNINTATKEELMTIKGIGEAKANAIIEYRKANPFKSIDDIKNVKGIGEVNFQKIKSELAVSGKNSAGKEVAKKSNEAKEKATSKTKEKATDIKSDMKNSKDKVKTETKKAKNELKAKTENIAK